MVARHQVHWQGGDSRDALPGWGRAEQPSLTAGTIRYLLHQSKFRRARLWVYTILLLNADVTGFVAVTNDELAHATDYSIPQARETLYSLRRSGEIVLLRKGTRWRKSEWRITRVAELAA